jgi:KTSC domain-containing protein
MIYVEPLQKSETIAVVGYDVETSTLEVHFKALGGTRRYRYAEVPKKIAETLVKADSPGAYFHRYVKNVYRYESIPSPKAE